MNNRESIYLFIVLVLIISTNIYFSSSLLSNKEGVVSAISVGAKAAVGSSKKKKKKKKKKRSFEIDEDEDADYNNDFINEDEDAYDNNDFINEDEDADDNNYFFNEDADDNNYFFNEDADEDEDEYLKSKPPPKKKPKKAVSTKTKRPKNWLARKIHKFINSFIIRYLFKAPIQLIPIRSVRKHYMDNVNFNQPITVVLLDIVKASIKLYLLMFFLLPTMIIYGMPHLVSFFGMIFGKFFIMFSHLIKKKINPPNPVSSNYSNLPISTNMPPQLKAVMNNVK